MKKMMQFVAMILFVFSAAAWAQQDPLIGTWERFSLKNAQGAVTQPPSAPAFAIFTSNNYFSITAIPAGRKKIDKPLAELTKEELLDRFQNLNARRGTYSVSGNRLTRKDVSRVDPNLEGGEQIQEFRIDGDVLILTTPGNQAEARFRRVR